MTFAIFCEENGQVTARLLIVPALLARLKEVYQCHGSLNRCLFRTAQRPLDKEHNKSLTDNFLNFNSLTAVVGSLEQCALFLPWSIWQPREEIGGPRGDISNQRQANILKELFLFNLSISNHIHSSLCTS